MKEFKKLFNHNYLYKDSAYARVNLIGEHTDYTGGFVLPLLLNHKTEIFISLNKEKNVVYSNLFNKKASFVDLKKSKNNHWSDYIKGCIKIINSNFSINNNFFNIFIKSNIPINRGISSSAALCVAFIKVMRKHYKLDISDKEIAFLAQRVEKEFIGVTGGIMDQMISSLGIKKKAFFLNCYSLKYELIDIPKDFIFTLIDSKIERKLRESSYNKRFKELKEAEKIVKIKYLGQLKMNSFSKIEFNNAIIKKRAKHVVSENERVQKAKKALENSNIREFGRLMNESHKSYSKEFEASNIHIDKIVKYSLKSGALGSRLTGGGFGGFIVSLINSKNYKKWKSNILQFSKDNKFIKI